MGCCAFPYERIGKIPLRFRCFPNRWHRKNVYLCIRFNIQRVITDDRFSILRKKISTTN